MNVTPDSFYAGSRAGSVDDALHMAETMVNEEADILDIGGEATNPNLDVTDSQIDVQEEVDRVAPVVEAIRARFDIDISVDTSKPEVMQAAVNAGATMINDQRALCMDGALAMAASLNVPVCLMHMYGLNNHDMNGQPLQTTLDEIKQFLLGRATVCMEAGIAKEHIILDPGAGTGNFGKSTKENLFILKETKQLVDLGYPVLMGYSRKSMIGDVLNGKPFDERLFGSIACAVMAAERGAAIVRVHDVGPTVDALRVTLAALSN